MRRLLTAQLFLLAMLVALCATARRGEFTPVVDSSGKALHAFHQSLKRTDRGLGQTRVLQFGASHTAADLFTGYLRQYLQHRFGDAGHGYVMPARPWKGYRHLDVRIDSSAGWESERVTSRGQESDLYGLAGFACESASKADYAWVGTSRRSAFGRSVGRFDVFYLKRPGGGRFRLSVDGQAHSVVETNSQKTEAGFASLRVPDGPHDLEIRPLGDGVVRLFGVVMERGAAGVVVDTLGIRGARASVFLRWDEDVWRSQIRRRNPDLVLLAYGTNESGDDTDPIARYERRLSKVLARMRAAVPHASCVLIGPTDRPQKARRKWQHRKRTDQIIDVQRAVSARFGCGFWDAVRAMGGPLSMVTWARATPPLAAKDHVHLTARGYYVLADDLARALLDGYKGPAPR